MGSSMLPRRAALKGLGAAAISAPFVAKAWGQAANRIVIGHQCDLTGVFSSWGYWMDKCARAAVDHVNRTGGIAGKQVTYLVEDSASAPAEGVRKLRSLVDRGGSHFIMGAAQSGVNLASAPIAKELQMVYFAHGMAEEKTGDKGNRYIFQIGSDTYQQAAAGTQLAVDRFGKEWTFIFSDFSWGWSHFNERSRHLKALGCKVNDPIAVPLDAKDYLPYLTRVPSSTNVIYPIAYGTGAISLFTQIRSMGLDKTAKIYSVVCTHEAISPKDLKGASEGFQFLEYHPRLLRYKDTEANRNFYKVMGVDEVEAREQGTARIAASNHCWAAWENVFFIKKAIEKSGWRAPADTPSFIQALEGMSVEESLEHPQGAKRIRAEDHKAIFDVYLSEVENGEFHVKGTVRASEYEARMPPKVDFTTEKV